MKKKFYELKEGDRILVFGDAVVIKKIEFSGKGVKQGRAKCRLELENEATKERKVLVRLSDEFAELAI